MKNRSGQHKNCLRMQNKSRQGRNARRIEAILHLFPIILMAEFLPVVIDTIGNKPAVFYWEKLEVDMNDYGDRQNSWGIDIFENPIVVNAWKQMECEIDAKDINFTKEQRSFPWNDSLSLREVTLKKRFDSLQDTSVSYRYEEKFSETLSEYAQFENLYCASCSTAIPGLENTAFLNTTSQQMVPQGICIAENYMLISAYDKKKEENSVIYILSNDDSENRKLLATLVLPEKTHAGGIAYDGERVWVAGSDTETISAIAGERILTAAESGQASVFLKAYDLTLDCGVTASFLGYQDGRLWVGTFHSFFTKQGMLSVFRLDEEDGQLCLKRQFRMDIPNHAQGISFVRQDGCEFVVLSVSQGRFRDSSLYVYEETISDSRVILAGKWKFTIPPMAEELVSDGTYTYCLFESAATCYSDVAGLSCPWIVDRVCALDNKRLANGGG